MGGKFCQHWAQFDFRWKLQNLIGTPLFWFTVIIISHCKGQAQKRLPFHSATCLRTRKSYEIPRFTLTRCREVCGPSELGDRGLEGEWHEVWLSERLCLDFDLGSSTRKDELSWPVACRESQKEPCLTVCEVTRSKSKHVHIKCCCTLLNAFPLQGV